MRLKATTVSDANFCNSCVIFSSESYGRPRFWRARFESPLGIWTDEPATIGMEVCHSEGSGPRASVAMPGLLPGYDAASHCPIPGFVIKPAKNTPNPGWFGDWQGRGRMRLVVMFKDLGQSYREVGERP